MKILHVSKYYEPFKGGIEKVILELANGTVARGHEVVVLSSNMSWRYEEDMIGGVKVIRLPRMSVVKSQPLTPSFFVQAKKWMDWADIVQVHTPNPLAEMSVLWQDSNKPLVASYHCDVVRQKNLFKLYRPVLDRTLRRADQIVVSTPNHMKYSEPLKPYLKKCFVVPFGIENLANKSPEVVQRLASDYKKKYGDYFLFVGRMVPYKG